MTNVQRTAIDRKKIANAAKIIILAGLAPGAKTVFQSLPGESKAGIGSTPADIATGGPGRGSDMDCESMVMVEGPVT